MSRQLALTWNADQPAFPQAPQDLACYLGEDVLMTVTALTAVDITGQAIQFTLRSGPTANSPAILTKTIGAGVTITVPANGVFTVALTSTDTVALVAGDYFYDIQRTDSGNVTVLTTGRFTFLDQ